MSDNQLAEIAAIAPLPPAGGDPDHVTYSTIKGTYLYEKEEDGTMFEFDHVTRGWRLIEEEEEDKEEEVEDKGDELEAALVAGETTDTTATAKAEPSGRDTGKNQPVSDKKAVQEQLKKRRKEVIEERRNAKKAQQKGDKPPQKAIYVSGLPSTATNDELVDIFQKYGVLAEDVYTGKKKARVYVDEQGKGKGDGLVVFFKPESVKLAVDMLHNQPVYVGDTMVTLNVQPAVFDKEKGSSDNKKQETNSGPNYLKKPRPRPRGSTLNCSKGSTIGMRRRSNESRRSLVKSRPRWSLSNGYLPFRSSRMTWMPKWTSRKIFITVVELSEQSQT